MEDLYTDCIQPVYKLQTESRLGKVSIKIDRYINYIKKEWNFENLNYVELNNLDKFLKQCDVKITNEYKDFIDETHVKRFEFLCDVITDIYFSSNRNLLLSVNYDFLCNIEDRCSNYDNVDNYYNYYKAALVNELIKGAI